MGKSLYSNMLNGKFYINGEEIKGVESIDITTEVVKDISESKHYETNKKYLSTLKHTDCSLCLNFNSNEADGINVNKEFLLKFCGIDTSKLPDAYDIEYMKFKQCRTHKKKRINKKWAKKYGYKQIKFTSKGLQIKIYPDGSFEFVKSVENKE